MNTKRFELAEKLLLYLKDKGVEDPDLDIYISIIRGSPEDLNKAIVAGGNLNGTATEIIIRHQHHFKGVGNPTGHTFAEFMIESHKR